jgi:hypothetical protein
MRNRIVIALAALAGVALLVVDVAARQSWTTPWTATTGIVVTAAQLNETRDNLSVLRAGGIAISGQAANDIPYATSTTQFDTSSAFTFSGTQLTVGGASSRGLLISRSGSVDAGMTFMNSLKTFAIVNDSTGAFKIQDDSDGSPVISLNGNTLIFAATAGVSNNDFYHSATVQPGFLYYNVGNEAACGGSCTVDFNTQVYLRSGTFGSDIWTAPIAGDYMLCANIRIVETGASTSTVSFMIETTAADYKLGGRSLTSGQVESLNGCVIAPMLANDTAFVNLSHSGTITILGDNDRATNFSGRLMP